MLSPAEGTGHPATVLVDQLGDAFSTVGVAAGEGARPPLIGVVFLQANGALEGDLRQRGSCWGTDWVFICCMADCLLYTTDEGQCAGNVLPPLL